ncbi:glycosyl transferase family 1 [Shewanella benthica]|uniref:rhamnan synthesis F family protein n=1 Tax=Shewanella benthica TaxID=43661 RepID=UPI00187A2D43|nr:rhamnan synthesis F family protein [Shewanella benthica]MBE7213946.1 glycosyl transferase family 1 [Shewanella benthica]MCL1063835.1 glycosyl transferase family 1 [Shewanella benthica]
MNFRSVINNKLPRVAKFIKTNPKVLALAKKVEAKVNTQQFRLAQSRSNKPSFTLKEMTHFLNSAKSMDLFDYSWYSKSQRRTFSCELEAFEDFIHKSHFSNVNPSASFDTEIYYKANTDIYHLGENALLHYIGSGKAEGRMSSAAVSKWRPSITLDTSADKECSSFKIAVCLHIFYDDFIDYYASCLKNFPSKVDLFISVSDEKFVALVDEKLTSLSTVNKTEVRVVPNRGRNFGPMLVEFSKELLSYDLFCHLHSKKSLYSGRQQTQWADYLGEYLLNDKHVIKQVLNQFDSDPECGIYYPTSFWMMPNWVNHWLKNKPFSNKMVDEWGIELKSDFLPYPAGGMFWARPSALKQLLDKDYQYEDFPAEPLPNDGSELHALERGLGLLAEKNGFKQLFYYPPSGELTFDQTYILASYVNTYEGIENQLAPFETISFDVFDTLVRRRFFVPDYAKLLLGKKLVSDGIIDDAHEFVKQRNYAEFAVRQQKNFIGDVTIFETYAQLATSLHWDQVTAKHYAKLEFAFDLEMIEPKNEMVDVINNAIITGKEVLVVSDTYYTEYQVNMMLRKVGVANGYRLLVSSETGFRKDNGSMWAFLKEEITQPDKFIHVGDNAVADSQIPGDFGFNNYHILNPIDKWQAAGWVNPFLGDKSLDEKEILKWGPLVSQFGRFPFLGE